MERLEDVLARQRQNLVLDILLVVALVIALGATALSLGAQSSACSGADNPPRVVHAGHGAPATPI